MRFHTAWLPLQPGVYVQMPLPFFDGRKLWTVGPHQASHSVSPEGKSPMHVGFRGDFEASGSQNFHPLSSLQQNSRCFHSRCEDVAQDTRLTHLVRPGKQDCMQLILLTVISVNICIQMLEVHLRGRTLAWHKQGPVLILSTVKHNDLGYFFISYINPPYLNFLASRNLRF